MNGENLTGEVDDEPTSSQSSHHLDGTNDAYSEAHQMHPTSPQAPSTTFPLFDTFPVDCDFTWPEFRCDGDLLLCSSNERDESAAASFQGEHDMARQVSLENDSRPQKRPRQEQDDTVNAMRRSANQSDSNVNAPTGMHQEEAAERTSSRQPLDTAQSPTQDCQQHVANATTPQQPATNCASEAIEQQCDELLQQDTCWNESYKLLLRFCQTHGHANVPRNPSQEQKDADPNLGKLAGWVGRQRTNYRRPEGDDRRPLPYQIVALQRVGFDFDPHQTTWMRRYAQLKDFKANHGHFDVASVVSKSSETANTADNDYISLAGWVKRQQHQYKLFRQGNSKSEMTEERIRMLQDIGFPFGKRAKQWMERYNAVKAYQQQHGNAPDSNPLYDWIKDQRKQLKRYNDDPDTSTLSQQQVALLRELPLDVDLRASSWSTRFHELLQFQRQHGHCILPTRYPFNQRLASWAATQRRQYQLLMSGKPSQITQERIKRLADAGFEWNVSSKRRQEARLSKTWDELHAEMVFRLKETATLDVGNSRELQTWLTTQRQECLLMNAGKPSQLTADQYNKLVALGIAGKDDNDESSLQGLSDCKPKATDLRQSHKTK